MGVTEYFGVDEWKSVLLVSIFLFIVSGLSLLLKFFLWFFFICGTILLIWSFYMVFIRKSPDKESVKDLGEYMGTMFKR